MTLSLSAPARRNRAAVTRGACHDERADQIVRPPAVAVTWREGYAGDAPVTGRVVMRRTVLRLGHDALRPTSGGRLTIVATVPSVCRLLVLRNDPAGLTHWPFVASSDQEAA